MLASAAALALAWASADRVDVDAHAKTDVTWTREISRILDRRCAGCHRRGAIGPMDLTEYADARQWAPAIKRSVLDRRMPPWQPSSGFGDFANDLSLTPYESDLLIAWVNGGTRIGEPADLTGGPTAAPRPAIDRPDLVLPFPAATVTSARRSFELGAVRDRDRWILSWEFRPYDLARIRDATLSIGPVPFWTWTPGESAVELPPGIGLELPAGTGIRVDVRYRESAAGTIDASALALRFGARPGLSLRSRRLEPGSHTFDRTTEIVAIRPILHSAASGVQVIARRTDGSSEPLLVIPRYDPERPVTYRFKQPVRLPARTAIEVRSFERDGRVDVEIADQPISPASPRR